MLETEHMDHDAVCADLVGEILDLGGFQQEFPVYLTCYVDNGECFYYVSNNRMHVYEFIDDKLKEGLYCIPLVRKSMRCIVSAGQKDSLYQQYKVTAAMELMKEGAGNISKLLPVLAPKQTGEAQEIMELLRTGLKGVFHAEKRQLYRGLLDMAYYSKKINGIYYNRTMKWLDIEEQRLEEERILHSVHERVYSGFGYYKTDGSIGYYTNAVLESTLARREEMMIAGTIVSPILMKRYCFNDVCLFSNVITKFKELLKKNIDANFMKIVDAVHVSDNISDGIIDIEIENAIKENDKLKEQTLKYYKTLWQI